MRELPIIFSTPMVKAILEGKKFQTQRPIKGMADYNRKVDGNFALEFGNPIIVDRNGEEQPGKEIFAIWFGPNATNTEGWHIKSSIAPGDHLWVREKFRLGAFDGIYYYMAFDYAASPELKQTPWRDIPTKEEYERIFNHETQTLDGLPQYKYGFDWKPGESPCPWIPSIHMPKFAARIWLEVTDVRVQRLQDINEEEAFMEGVNPISILDLKKAPVSLFGHKGDHVNLFPSYRAGFFKVWDSLYGDDPVRGWDANPWNWVIEFKRIERPEETIK